MSVLIEFAMFPTDKGESVSKYVSKVIKKISESNITYKVTPMGTIIETNTFEEALDLLKNFYKVLEPESNRVYLALKADIRKNKNNRMKTKIASIENKIGKINT